MTAATAPESVRGSTAAGTPASIASVGGAWDSRDIAERAGRGGSRSLDPFDLRQPAIPARRNGLDVAPLAGFVAERTPELCDDPRQGVIGDGRIRPDRFEDFLFGEEMARTLDDERQQVERFRFERNRRTAPLEPVGVEVEQKIVPAVSSGHV